VIVAASRTELADNRDPLTGRVAVVLTMGALHAGHASLLRHARAAADHLLATIFVNPLQFGPTEDLGRYPRSLDADLRMCRVEGVDLVFAPTPEELYPDGEAEVRVHPGPLGTVLEGASRPGHFAGVLTVVLKLFQLTRPHLAFFGEKDYQQLTLIRRMVRDLDLRVDVRGVPTVREPDGLALSSRNRYLAADQRAAALALSASLAAGATAAGSGAGAARVLAAARAVLCGTAGVEPDYLELTDPYLRPVTGPGLARLLVAARVGGTRLIDNAAVELFGTAAADPIGTAAAGPIGDAPGEPLVPTDQRSVNMTNT
jgi:pantoate--beta-alanine ligase